MLKKITPLLLLLLCSFELFAAPLRIKPQANDDYASVTVGVRPSVSINLSTNDRYGSFFYINGSTYGEYGFLELAGNAIVNSSDPTFGAFYTYTLYENDTNANLAPGQVVTDTFTYTYANDVGQSSDARIIIQVTGNQRVPVAVDDYASVVVGITPTASGNLASNDRNGNIVTINGSSAGHYGVLELIGNTGIYTYTLYDNDTNSNLATGQTYQDIFTYTYINNLGQSATARLIVNVTRNQQPPIATPDFASVIVGVTPGAAGNLSTNDRNGSIITLDATTPGAG